MCKLRVYREEVVSIKIYGQLAAILHKNLGLLKIVFYWLSLLLPFTSIPMDRPWNLRLNVMQHGIVSCISFKISLKPWPNKMLLLKMINIRKSLKDKLFSNFHIYLWIWKTILSELKTWNSKWWLPLGSVMKVM